MSDGPERRNSSRFHAGLPVVLRVRGDSYPVRGADLSRQGLQIVGEFPPDAGPELELTVRTPAGDLHFDCKARVTRTGRDEQGLMRMGLEFTEVDYEHRATLEAMIARVLEGLSPAAIESLPPNPTPAQVRNALENTPLSQRINLATRALPKHREVLFQDPSPQVIDALARNPQLLANEVRVMLRMPLLLPMTLETLARDARWRGNKELRILIASHHNASYSVVEMLTKNMDRESARRLIQAPGLNPALRTKLLKRFGF
jgi:hypothetical protein